MNIRCTHQVRGAHALRLATALFCLAALLAPAAVLAADTAPPKKLATIEGITEYRLENGLRVLLFPDPSSPNVTVNLTVFVGSRHEGYGETGMAHLLEHMVFKGTPTHPDVPKVLKDHGAQFNGTTWVDRTNYFETMAGTDDNLEFGIKLEADRMVNSFIKREDLVKEFTVVRNEFEMGENSPERILSQRMMAAAYEWHNYGKSTIGNRSDIERVPIDRLQGFYKKFYRPDNAMLVVAGKFDEKKALDYIGKYFGVLKNPATKLETTYTEEPAQDGERHVTLRRVGKVGVVGVLYHIPAGSHADYAACEMLNSILVDEPSGRLYQALVPTKKANSVSGVAYGWHDPGVLEVSAEVDPQKSIDDVRDTIVKVLEELKTQKITDEEVGRARNRFKRNLDLQLAKSNTIGVTLSEWGAKGDWRLFFLHRDRVAKVTAADVMNVAGKYLQRNNRTLGVFIPTDQAQRVAIPETPDVDALVKEYKGGESVVAGEVFEPTPENIEKRVKRVGGRAFLAKKTRGETVVLHLTLHFGNEKSLLGQRNAAALLGPMMVRGTQKHSRQQLQDDLDKLGARLNVGSDLGSVNFTLEVKRSNLKAAFALLEEVIGTPTFPAEEFDILKREQLDRLKKGTTEPTALAFRALQRQLAPYPKDNVRYMPTYPEEIERLEATTLDQLKQLYAKQLGSDKAVMVLVGDIDPEPDQGLNASIASSLTTTLGTLKATEPYQRITRAANPDVKANKEIILTPDKANAFYIAGHTLALNDSDPDFAALDVANFLFGGGTLSSRIGNRVRQKEGLSYGAVSIFAAQAKDKSAGFFMYAICNPENIDKVDRAIAEELEMILKDGITAKELDEAKAAYLKQRQVRRATDAALSALLADGLENERTFAYHADLEKQVAGLTVDAVNAAIRKHWQPKKLVAIRAGDFKKSGQ